MKSLNSFINEANKCPKGYYFDNKSKSCQPKKSGKVKSYGYPRFGGGSRNDSGNGNGNGSANKNGHSGNGNGNGNGGNGGNGANGGGNGGNGGGGE